MKPLLAVVIPILLEKNEAVLMIHGGRDHLMKIESMKPVTMRGSNGEQRGQHYAFFLVADQFENEYYSQALYSEDELDEMDLIKEGDFWRIHKPLR